MSSGFFDPKYGLGGKSAWYGRGLARGLAFTQEQAAEALDLGSDYSGGLFSYFARPAEQALRQRAAALREWSQTPEYASGLERFGEGATEIAATLPAYIAATQAGGLIPGMAAMGYLRGRPEGRGFEEAAIEGTLGAVFGATEPLSRLPRAAINAITSAKLLEPEEGYQEPIDFLAPAVVGGFSAVPNAVPRARGAGVRRSAGGEQPGSVESPLPPTTLLTNEDQLVIARMIQSEQIDAKGAMIARIERLKPFADVDPAAKAEIGRIEKTLNLIEAGARDPRADYRGERSAFVQRQMDDRGLSEMEATENWRNVISERIEDAPELGLESAQARVREVTDQLNTVRTMKPIELYEAGLLGDQVTPRPKARVLGNQKKKLLRTLSDRLERLESLEQAESRLSILRDDLSQYEAMGRPISEEEKAFRLLQLDVNPNEEFPWVHATVGKDTANKIRREGLRSPTDEEQMVYDYSEWGPGTSYAAKPGSRFLAENEGTNFATYDSGVEVGPTKDARIWTVNTNNDLEQFAQAAGYEDSFALNEAIRRRPEEARARMTEQADILVLNEFRHPEFSPNQVVIFDTSKVRVPREKPGGASPEGSNPIFQEPLGLSREPVIYTELSELSDRAFDVSNESAIKNVDRLEKLYDENPELVDTDANFRRDLIRAQDNYTAHELELWRRGLDEGNPAATPEDLARDIRGLNLKISEDKVKAAMVMSEMSRRGPEAQRRFKVAMGDYAKRSPDHAEILEAQMGDLEEILNQASARRNLPQGESNQSLVSAAIEQQKRAPNEMGVRDTPGSEPPIESDPIFQEPLGVYREPVLYPHLADLSDDAFDASYKEANQRSLRIVRLFDDAPELADTDPAFRREMVQAQDDYTAHELEQWRRGIKEGHPAATPEDLARDIRGLNLQISDHKVKATMIAAEMSRRSPEAQRRFNVAMADYAKRSPDHAEVLQGKLEDFTRVMDEAGTRNLPQGESSQSPVSAAIKRQKRAPNEVGVRDTPGSEPPIEEVPLVQRQPWTLTRSEEATLQGVSEDVIRALERAPKPGPDRVNAKGEKLPPLSYGGPMARGLPAATEQEITMLKLAGFMDKDGFLTAKGEETLSGRRKRFDDNRARLQQGEAVPAQVLLEWPDQMERAARVDQTARKRGGNRPGSSESDNLTVDDLRLAEDDTIRNRRQLDEQRGRDFLEDERNKELTTRRLSAEQEIRIQDAAVELSEMAGFDLVPSKERPFYEQVMDLINSDRIPLIGIADVLERNGLSLADFADAYGLTVRESAQTLARQRQMGARIARQYGVKRLDDVAKVLEVSRPRRELLRERLRDPNLSSADRKALEWELSSGYLTKNEIKMLKEMGVDRDMVMGKGLWRRLENARRGLLVIQFSTAMRNLLTSVGNITVSMMNEANERAIRGFVRGTGAVTGNKAIQDYGKSIHPVRGFENLISIFEEIGARVTGQDGSKIVSDVLNMFPNEADTLVSSFNSDIATIQANRVKRSGSATEAAHQVVDRLEATSNVLNTLNRFQEHVIRRAAFRAELERQVKMNPIVIRDKTYSSLRQLEADNLLGKLPQKMVQNAVDRGLSMTWSSNFDKQGAIQPLIDFVNRVPVASWLVPFPRFTANAIQWQLEHSPAGILRYASEQQRNNFLAGDISGISKAMTGSTLMMYALDMANSEYSTGDWNLYEDPETGELLDLNPFQPFASYAFWAHVLTRSMQPGMSPEGADLGNMAINLSSGPTGLAYNFLRQALGQEKFEQFQSQEGDPVKLRRLTFPDIVRGIGAGNMRSGLGLYAIDKLIADGFTEKSLPVAPFEGYADQETGGTIYSQDIDVPLRGSSRSSGSAFGDFVGGFAANYFGSYLTGLGDIMNAYKEYKSWEGDLDASNVGNPIAFQEVEDPRTGQVSRMPYDGFVDNLTNSFEESFKARFPMVFDSRPIYVPTQEDPIRTYRPGSKTVTGVIYKQPMNYAQELASDFDLTQSDILPSTGNPVWDDLVKEKMGQYIEPYVIAYVKDMGEEYPASAARQEYFEGLTYSNKILYLKDRFKAAANEARRDARRDSPALWDQVDKSRQSPLDVQAARERAAQMQGRAMVGEQR